MDRGWNRPLRLAALCWLAFVVLLLTAYWLPFARWADGWAVQGFLQLQRPWLTRLATHIAHLANPGPFALGTLVLAGIALKRRRPRTALAVVILLGSANVAAQILKLVLAHERYHDFLGHSQLAAAAFPSGHATASMTMAFAAVLVAPRAWRPLVALAGAAFALAVSESVMLLGWHFPSDVAGGFLLATAFLLMTLAALRWADARWPERSGREAARRALIGLDGRRAFALGVTFAALALASVAAAAGGRTVAFAGHHTIAAVAAVTVAAMAAALPVLAVAAGTRRP